MPCVKNEQNVELVGQDKDVTRPRTGTMVGIEFLDNGKRITGRERAAFALCAMRSFFPVSCGEAKIIPMSECGRLHLPTSRSSKAA